MRKAIILFILLASNSLVFGQNSSTGGTRSQTTKPSNKAALLLPPPPEDGGTIAGPQQVTYGQTNKYSFAYGYPDVTWSVTNGTIISSSFPNVEILWDQGYSDALLASGSPIYATLSVYSEGTLKATLSITVAIPPINAGSISPANQTVVLNQNSSPLTYSGATGGVGGAFSYQWQYSNDLATWTNITGATGLTYHPGISLTNKTYYRVVASLGVAHAYSSTAQITRIVTATPPPVSTIVDSTYSIDLSKYIGSTSGSISVNSSGAAQYTIPIEVLPGSNGLQPNISLFYNSRAGTGITGRGWNLSCLSMIKRTGKKFYYDGVTTPVSFADTNDVYELDGQRLFPLTGVNGANGTTYGKERNDFSKIVSYGASSGSSGPDWFQVTTKEGTILEYGRVSDSKYQFDNKTLIWLLNRVTDRNGNYCVFNYNIDPDQSSFALAEIDYTGNTSAGITPYNKILFSYSIKPNSQNSGQYVNGGLLTSPYLLDTITVVNSAGSKIKSYMFTYKTQHGEYYLKTTTERGSDGSLRNPIVFSYGSNITTSPVALSPMLTGLATNGSIYSGNFHGNSRAGIISANQTINNNGDTLYTGFSMYGDIGKDPNTPALHLDYSEHLNTTDTVYDLLTGPRGRYDALTSDYDGDGRSDVLFTGFSDSSGIRRLTKVQINFTRLKSNGTYGYDSTVNKTMPTIAGMGKFDNIGVTYIIPGDFDGDGYQDYILILGVNRTDRFKAFFCSPHRNIFNIDIRNFGIESSTIYPDEYYASSVAFSQIRPVDFDGDGKTDLMISDNAKTYFLRINNIGTENNYILQAKEIYSVSDIKAGLPIFSGDFNGDGKTDFLIRSTKETGSNSPSDHTGIYGNWYLYYSTGISLHPVPFIFKNAPALKGDGFSNTHLLMVSDLNGDGKSDIWHSLDFYDENTSVPLKLKECQRVMI